MTNRPGERDHGEGTEPGAAPRDDEREHGTLLLLWLPRVLPFATWRRVVLRSRRPADYRGVLLLGDRGAGARHSGLSPGLPPPAALRHRRPGRPAAHVRFPLLSGEPLLLLAFMAATHTKTKSDRPTKPTEFFLPPPPAPPLISLPRATLKTPTYSSRRTTRTCFAGPTRAWHKTTERSRRRRCEGRKGNGAGGERESKGPSSPHLPSSCVVQSSAMSYIFWETVIRTHWCYCPSPPARRSAILSFNASLRLGNFCSYS